MKRLLSAAAAMMVLGSGAALAQPMGFDGYGARGHGHHDRGGHGRRGQHGMAVLEAADLNGDNTVTRAELDQLLSQEFSFRDRNSDGFLDEADASPMQQRRMAMREERRDARAEDGEARGPRREGRRGGREGFDANDDGRVSAEEFRNRTGAMFDRLDADSDGAVTPAELDAMMEARAERRERRRAPWWRN